MRDWLRKSGCFLMPAFIGVVVGVILGICLSTKFNQVKFGDWGEWAGAVATFAAVVFPFALRLKIGDHM